MSFAYYNGIFGDFNEIRLPLSDRSIFFGDGVYDAAIGRNGKIFLEDLHVERFLGNAKKIGLPLAYGKNELSYLLHKTVEDSRIPEFFLYFQASGYLDERLHAPRSNQKSNLLITVKPYSLPNEKTELSLVTFSDTRQSFCNIKTLNLLGSVMASEYAHDSGADEAVFVLGETVTECSRSNIFIVSGSKLITHPENEKILPGITRRELLLSAKKHGIPTEERRFSLSELIDADDVLVTSTSKLALRAKWLDGIEISKRKSDIAGTLIDDMFKCYRDFC